MIGVLDLYGVIAIPLGTILLLMGRDIVGKTGAATFTQFVSGMISTLVPGRPPVIWIILPTWILDRIVIDLFLRTTHQKISTLRVAAGIAGLIYKVVGDLVLFWAFNAFLG